MKISAYQKNTKTSDGMYKLYFAINHACKRTLLDTGIKTSYHIIKVKGTSLGFSLDRKEPAMRAKMKRLEKLYWEIDEFVVSHPTMRPEAIKMAFSPKKKGNVGMLIKTIYEYADSGKIGKSTAEIMKRTARKINEFDPTAGFTIDEEWLDRFYSHLINNKIKVNGASIHLRNIRTVFNYARKKRLTKEYPFLDYKIKEERKQIRNMSVEQIREFKDYPCEAWQVEYRDIFMLMVYLAGVNIGDLLICKGLVNGRLVYNRNKTDKPMSIFVCEQAKAIIEKYKGKDYLLSPMDRYKDYHGYLHKINDGLKKIGKVKIVKDKVGKMRKHEVTPFFEGLTTYVARYTFASIAAECGIERDIIAACLGHSWADVTSHYIAYSQKQMDDAIKKVADYIQNSSPSVTDKED